MIKNPVDKVEGNIEVYCSERIKSSVKSFQLSLLLVHLMIPFQRYLISIFNIFEDLEKFRSAAYWPTFENSNFLSLS